MEPDGVNDAFTTMFKFGAYSSSGTESGCMNAASNPLASISPVMMSLWILYCIKRDDEKLAKFEGEEEEEKEDEKRPERYNIR